MFWNDAERPTLSILAGNIDDTSGLEVKGHIFVSEKQPFFEISDGLPQFDTYPPEGTR